ncbi:sensor histidine kinase [Paenibacillus sambharensis]|uniref:histidine kinase n=1 Tax=Paenibacillus sambharensis TaxID=1803190 RepID=A0A2W1LHJ1_9BACL|nr:MFS domain-containing histidine kinase [Paenibacillus sambharensis]PZD94425.1 sensor histidine kinase [Paenibacillus sambharensis]
MPKLTGLAFLLFIVIVAALSVPSFLLTERKPPGPVVTQWQLQWITDNEPAYAPHASIESGEWILVTADHPVTVRPDGVNRAWIRFTVPPTSLERPGLLIDKLYGHDIKVYNNNRLVYESNRTFMFDNNKLLLPLDKDLGNREYLVGLTTMSDRIGIQSEIRIGDLTALSESYVKRDLPDLLLGGSVVFIASIMLVCSGFLTRRQRDIWISLCLVALSTGVLLVVYSPITYMLFGQYGHSILLLFDVSLFVLLPSVTYFFDRVFEGKYPVIRKFWMFQMGYSLFSIVFLVFNVLTEDRFYNLYYFFTVTIMGIAMILQFVLLTALALLNAVKGNKDAVILSVGIAMVAVASIADLAIFYFRSTHYELFLWKIGVICLIGTLVVLLARRIAADHDKLLAYSKELELFNHKLQRTEKMQIISELAASVAHEVRNPLQVTRGFLQLLSERTDNQNRVYMQMAIDELDRASGIITDFLTFAKPELDELVVLNVAKEIKQIEGILSPLATQLGASLVVDIPEDLLIMGNSSKFKQAFINMMKNSVEALNGKGCVQVWAYEAKDKVVVHIFDNGEGMDEQELSKLGEPYFSTKTKGTGLGLMVTFRIIEVMNGTIEFKSKKGAGTEAIVKFPAVDRSSLPDGVGA